MRGLLAVTILFLTAGAHGASPPTVLVFGDSLSAGFGIEVDQSWTALLQARLREQGYEHRVINASISGDTTESGATRIGPAIENFDPELIILELGGNDGLRGLGFEQSTENLRQMVALAKDRSVTVLLIGVRMPPNFGAVYNKRFQQIFETITAEFGIHYLPRFLEGIAASDPALMQADGIHPTAIAQPILAQKVEAKMIPILNH